MQEEEEEQVAQGEVQTVQELLLFRKYPVRQLEQLKEEAKVHALHPVGQDLQMVEEKA